MTHFQDPREQTRRRAQLDMQLRRAAQRSRERRRADTELGLHDPDRLHELVSAAHDTATARVGAVTVNDPTTDDIDPSTQDLAAPSDLDTPDFDDVLDDF